MELVGDDNTGTRAASDVKAFVSVDSMVSQVELLCGNPK
jgi:hypothetical protein